MLVAAALSVTVAVAQSLPGATTADALAQLEHHDSQAALVTLTKILAATPDDVSANLLAAAAEIALYDGPHAVTYAERARQLDPGNWKVHTTLVTAYTMAGDTNHRDAERATLRQLHESATAPEARASSGFLLDLFRVKDYRVEAVEYFKPLGKFHLYYRFILKDADGNRIWQISVVSDDFNQSSWARAYPQQAAEGQRQFQITGESPGGSSHVDYTSFSGSASYDYARSRVVAILNAQTGPFGDAK